jgi:choline-sulfatase
MKVLYLDIDTLRADHMGCYGYGRDTTPNLDRIAREGVMFTNYYCSDAPCLPSRSALISGKFGIRNGAVGHGGTAADRRLTGSDRSFRDSSDTNNFNNLFRKKAMKTASISTFAERHSAWWYHAGFHETFNVGSGGMESAEQVIPVALDWIERNAKLDDWYLHLNLWDPHTPYRAPADYGRPYDGKPLPDDWITREIFKEHRGQSSPHGANEINMFDDKTNPKYPRHPGRLADLEDVKRFIDDYDTGISYTDHMIGKVIDLLKERGCYEDLAIIISSDHGENMGEFGIYGEHATADYPTCRIPLIIKWPGCKAGHTDNALHYNVDLAPTVADLLALEASADWDGKSFAATVTEGRVCSREFLVLSQMAHVCQRSVRFREYLYIRTYHCGYHLFPEEMLFDIKRDPHQLEDLSSVYPQLCAEASGYYARWLEEMLAKTGGVDPLWTVLNEGGPFHAAGQLTRYIQRMKDTGRGSEAEKLLSKYTLIGGK